jgi:hypothetical protein
MASVPRRIAMLLVSTAAIGGLTAVTAPAASAEPAPATVSAARWDPPRCRPTHVGRDWRWDETRRGGHWDHRVWNRRTHRMEWQHLRWDDHRCLPPHRGGPRR